MIEFDLPDDAAMQALGAALVRLLRAGDVIALYGGLGAGKTTLARGLIRALMGADIEVPSPTYTLVQTYDTDAFTLWHFDLYRIENPSALDELGWRDTGNGVALVEWPERADGHLPQWRLDIDIAFDGDGRKARLEPHGEDWQNRLHGFARSFPT